MSEPNHIQNKFVKPQRLLKTLSAIEKKLMIMKMLSHWMKKYLKRLIA
jgi:hypothetical protein